MLPLASLRAVKLEVEQAQESVDDLTKQVEEARGRVSLDDGAQVRLDELERDMNAKALLYDTFLKRAGEVGEQERMAVSNLRVVTQPLPPDQPNMPNPTGSPARAAVDVPMKIDVEAITVPAKPAGA